MSTDRLLNARVQLRAANARVRAPSGIRWALRDQQLAVSHNQFRELLKILKFASPIGSRLVVPIKSRSYKEIFSQKFPDPTDASIELRWAAVIAEENKEFINVYLNIKKDIEKCILRGQYDIALLHLDSLQREVGDSIWSLEMQTSAIQALKGLQEQKTFTSRIAKESEKSFLAPIASLISERNEPTTTVDGFIKSFKAQHDTWNVPRSIYIYLTIRVLGRAPQDNEDIATVLSIDQYSSIIDYYESLVMCLLEIVAKPELFSHLRGAASSLLPHLANIQDTRLSKLNLLTSKTDHDVQTNAEDVDDSVKIYESAVDDESEPSDIDDIEIRRTPRDELISYFHSILCRSENRHEAWAKLYKLLLNFKGLDLCLPLRDLLMRRSAREGSNYFLPASFALLNSKNPLYLSGLGHDAYRVALAKTDFNSSETNYTRFKEARENPSAITIHDPESVQIEAMFQSFRNKDYETTINHAKALKNSNTADFKWEAIRLDIEANAFLGNSEIAIRNMAEICSKDMGYAEELPLTDLFGNKRWRDLKSMPVKELAVCLYTYVIFSRDSNAIFSLKQCVVKIYREGIRDKLVAAARSTEKLAPIDQVILQEILTEDYLNLVPDFKLSEDLDKERLLICQVLLHADKENSSVYEQQIRALSYKSAVNAGMQQIDQTRIYVDFSGVRRWAEKNLRENFFRWVELTKIDPMPALDVKEILAKIVERPNEVPSELLVIPSSQADQVLIQILQSLLNRFLYDSQDGLNSYLSLRVRHGTLDGMLRSPFKEEDILTITDLSSSSVLLGNSMEDLITVTAPSLEDDLTRILSEFTNKFNECVGNFIKQEIRIKSDEFPDGLIDIAITRYTVNVIKADLLANMTFDALLEHAFQSFSISLRNSLVKIQDRMQHNVKATIEHASREVRQKVFELPERDNISFVTDRLGRAMVAFQGAIVRAIEWFQFKPGESLDRTFEMEEMLNIAIQMTKDLCPGFNYPIEIIIEGDFPQFSAATLISVSDAIFIMLDNVFKHSGLPGGSVKINVSFVKVDGIESFIKFAVTNEISPMMATPDTIKNVEYIARLLSEGTHGDLLSREGGTGLAKLSRLTQIIDASLDEPPLTFGFLGTDKFFTSLCVPFKTFLIGSEDV